MDRSLNKERGFNMLEVLLALIILTISTLVIFTIVNETNKVDLDSKRLHFAETLINPYIAYYQNTEVQEEDVDVYLSDLGEVDLVKEFKRDSSDGTPSGFVPKTLRDVRVGCKNTPRVVGDYMVFEIKCHVNDREINKGRAYTIKKYIN